MEYSKTYYIICGDLQNDHKNKLSTYEIVMISKTQKTEGITNITYYK